MIDSHHFYPFLFGITVGRFKAFSNFFFMQVPNTMISHEHLDCLKARMVVETIISLKIFCYNFRVVLKF